MRSSDRTAAELRAAGWSPVDVLGAPSLREAKELVLRYELSGVPLLLPLGAPAHEVYAPGWSHELLRAYQEAGLTASSTTVNEVVRQALRRPDAEEWVAAVCSALKMGGYAAVHAIVYAEPF